LNKLTRKHDKLTTFSCEAVKLTDGQFSEFKPFTHSSYEYRENRIGAKETITIQK